MTSRRRAEAQSLAMKRGDTIISHWSVLLDGFNTSGLDFFERVKERIEVRATPDVSYAHKDFKESGVMSAKRTYFRVRRSNLVFDISAAPYGNGFFFSWWLVREGPRRAWAYLLGFFLIVFFVPLIISVPFFFFGPLVYPLALVSTLFVLGRLARTGAFGPEENILALPVIGWLYELLFSPPTYYALDTAAMFQESIRRSVNEALDATLSDQGKKALSSEQKQLTMRDLADL